MNIFGGIVDCEMIARGIQNAYEKLKVDVPLVVRLEGKSSFNIFLLRLQFPIHCLN